MTPGECGGEMGGEEEVVGEVVGGGEEERVVEIDGGMGEEEVCAREK